MGEPQKLTPHTPIRNKVRDTSTVNMQVLLRLTHSIHSLCLFIITNTKKKERQTTIIGDLTPACGCADATLVLATTAPAIRRQGGFRTPTSGRQADMLTH